MFCSKCGVQNSDEAKFCKQCGNELKTSQTTDAVASTASAPTGDASQQVQMKCGLCNYVGPVKRGRRVVSQILAWLPMLLFMWIVPVIYYMLTDKYVCPKCDSNILSIKNNEGVYKAQRRGNNALVIVLVVMVGIAFVGILASVVLASLNSARDKGQDASTKSALTTARAQAELFYDSNFNSYEGVCNDLKVKTALSNAQNSQSVAPKCNDSSVYYAISAPLSSGNHFCVDSYGNSVTITSPLKYETICPKGVQDTLN